MTRATPPGSSSGGALVKTLAVGEGGGEAGCGTSVRPPTRSAHLAVQSPIAGPSSKEMICTTGFRRPLPGRSAAPRVPKSQNWRVKHGEQRHAGIVYSLITAYELGMASIISVPAHLGLDAAGGILLAISPWLFGFANQVFWPHLIVGLIEIGTAAMTKRHADTTRRV